MYTSVVVAKLYQEEPSLIVNLALTYGIMTVLVNMPSVWLVENYGVQKSLQYSAMGHILGAVLRLLAFWLLESPGYAYIGQVLIACNLVVQSNCWTKFGMQWYPDYQQNSIQAYLSLAQIMGYVITAIVSPLFIQKDDHLNPEEGFTNMRNYLFLTVALAVVFNLGILFKLKTPPSVSPSKKFELSKR